MANQKSLDTKIGNIRNLIYMIRGQKVLLDFDLAQLYEVKTKALKQAVRRNIDRFPEDFMFQLTKEELEIWRSQIATSNPGAKMGLRHSPMAFTEQGIAMLSSVLKSSRAIKVNIAIMRVFVQLRQLSSQYEELAKLLDKIDKKTLKNSEDIKIIIKALNEIMSPKSPPEKRHIGFIDND
jgi:hypothetical protein